MDHDLAPTLDVCGTPTGPWVCSDGYAPTTPAVPSIFPLNNTAQATPDLLLSALLTSTTTGINGSFQTVTSYVPSLGLDPSVATALGNAVVGGQGLYAAPAYKSPPPSSGGWLSDFVNAVTAIVTNPLGAIVSLVELTWTAEFAAFVYFTHLIVEAVAIGGQILSRAAATLVSVGKAIVASLERILSFIVTLIEKALSPVIQPVVNAMNQYTLHLASDIQQAYNDSSQNKPVAPDAARFWADVEAPLFIIVTAVAVVITAAITIIEGFSLGAAFLIPIIVGFVITGGAARLADGGGPSFISDFEETNPISSAMASAWEQIFDPPEYLPTLGTLLGIATTSWAATSIEGAWESQQFPGWTDEAGLSVGMIGLVTAGAASDFSSQAGAVASLFFDGASWILDIYSLLHKPGVQNACIAFMDGATVVIDANVLGVPV